MGYDEVFTQRVLRSFNLQVFSLHHSLIPLNFELAKFSNDVGGINGPFSLSTSTANRNFRLWQFREF